jgi:4-amino-4-deoxy-L-arabinose transferase-like glycosyltransferase
MTITVERPADAAPAAPAPPAPRSYERPALLGLLGLTALLYLWDLGASGWANAYYSAAAQAGASSWKAWFFGAFDSSSYITVDKPPVSIWVMGLSARLFGVNAWSILVPQALMGVASVGVLHAAVRRTFTAPAALLAGAVLALTPVAALMFRFNNPDALLVLLLTGAAYAMVRALQTASTRWLVVAAALVGTGFLTKMLQAFVLLPVFALVYLCCAPTPLRRRLVQLLAAGGALVVSAGWWVAAVTLWPASARPYIGGSQHNSVLELVLGYNGLGRLTGNETGSVGGGAAGATGRWGETGFLRMFNSSYGGQISWLIPAALVLMAALLWLSRRAPRDSAQRAQVLLWGGWLVVTGLVFSLAKGIIHEYYSVALAPAIGALVGIGAVSLWRLRSQLVARAALAAALVVTALWASVLLDRSASWHPWIRPTVVVLGLGAAVAVLALDRLPSSASRPVAVVGLVAALLGPTAYTLSTVTTPHSGSLPTAGPAVAGARFGGPAGGPGGGARFGTPPTGLTGGGPMGGGGGLLNASTPSAEVVQALTSNASSYTWVAAAVGANTAAGYQLASGEPVMAIGGFNGSDPTPTLAEFQQLVAEGKVHWFISGGMGMGGGPGGGSGTSSAFASWVQSTYTATTVGGITMYDLTAPAGTSAS